MAGKTRPVAAQNKRIGQYDSLDNDVVDFFPYSIHVITLTAEPHVEPFQPAEMVNEQNRPR